MTYCNGNVYEGHWQHDVRCGRGTLFHVDRGMRFDGEWAGDQPRAGAYSAMDVRAPGAAGALPVLELQDGAAVLADAMCG